MELAFLILDYVRALAWPVAAVIMLWLFREPLVATLGELRGAGRVSLDSRSKRHLAFAVVLMVAVVAAWLLGKIIIEHAFPPDAKGEVPWSQRGQFGDMFGSITSLLTALNLALLVYAIFLQVSETSRQNEISKWQANYNYLLDAKKLITDHPEVLELHGLSAQLSKELGVTTAQLTYVILDLKAADLYYRIDGRDPVEMTAYRLNMLEIPKYRAIAERCVVAGTLLPSSPFMTALRASLKEGKTKTVDTAED